MSNFTQNGNYSFNFTPSGFFTLVDEQGVPIYEYALPLFEKAFGHLVWIFFWTTLIIVSSFFPSSLWKYWSDRIIMSLIFFHLFVFGCRITKLLLKKGLQPILFPPLWIRITRKLQRGCGIELLKKHELDAHPGLLANLALIEHSRKNYKEAAYYMSKAAALAPDHSFLCELSKILIDYKSP